MIKDPVDYILDRKNSAPEKEDEFLILLNKKDVYLHVEDRDKNAFYESLLKKLYPNKKITIFANYDGKTSLLTNYYEKKEANNFSDKVNEFYLFDRDYENFNPEKCYKTLCNHTFNEINSEPRIIILKKTNIENYFLDEENFKEALTSIASIPSSNLINFSEIYKKIIFLTKKLSKYYLLNSYFETNLAKLTIQYIDLDTKKINEFFYSRLNIVKENLLTNNKITKPVLRELKEKINLERDIDGKQAHIYLSYAFRTLNLGSYKLFDNETILRTQVLILTETQKEELREIFRF